MEVLKVVQWTRDATFQVEVICRDGLRLCILVQLAGFSVVNWKCASCGNCMVSPRNGMWLIYQPCESILVHLQRMPCVHASNGFDLHSCALNWKYLPSWTELNWTRLNWTESVLPIKMCGIWFIKRIKSHWSGAKHN